MRIAVIGAGAWGTTMAIHLTNMGHDVVLWEHDPAYAERMRKEHANPQFLPNVPFPEGLDVASDGVGERDVLVGAVPTQFLRGVLERIGNGLPRAPFVSLSKGIEIGTGKLPTEIYREVVGADRPVAVLTGPCIAKEVVRGMPTAVVIAGDQAAMLQSVFTTDRFRVYTSDDRVGAELAAALKNVLAIAAGIVDGMRLGDNTKATLLTRGIVELTRLGVALGADAMTFTGLAGFGDLFTTCVSPHGRNRGVGERIGKGEKVEDILKSMDSVAEGVWTTRAVLALAKEKGVEMPITAALYSILYEGVPITAAVASLMTRDTGAEID